jgi:transcriptional regulator with XRE-family HTH domain
MDRHERRRKRLIGLIQEAGSQKLLAELIGTDPNYLSQIKNGIRSSFGEDLAERLEKAMKKPDGWMDQWLPEEGGYATANRPPDWFLLERLGELPDSIRKPIRDAILAYERELTQRPSKKAPAKKRKTS